MAYFTCPKCKDRNKENHCPRCNLIYCAGCGEWLGSGCYCSTCKERAEKHLKPQDSDKRVAGNVPDYPYQVAATLRRKIPWVMIVLATLSLIGSFCLLFGYYSDTLGIALAFSFGGAFVIEVVRLFADGLRARHERHERRLVGLYPYATPDPAPERLLICMIVGLLVCVSWLFFAVFFNRMTAEAIHGPKVHDIRPNEYYECKVLDVCRERGACHLVSLDRGCAPRSESDCKQSRRCRLYGECVFDAARGVCREGGLN